MIKSIPFIEIPLGALCCYLFLMLCFLKAPNNKIVKYFRFVLFSCLLWTGGATLMRLQLKPGIEFWFNISILGLVLIPLSITYFLFYILKIKSPIFKMIQFFLTVLAAVVNSIWGILIPPPNVIVEANGDIVYRYYMPAGAYVLAIIEGIMIAYVIVMTYQCIRDDRPKAKKIVPLVVGTIALFVGNLLTLIPENVFPFDTLGGLVLAFCIVFIMHKQYLFDMSYRAAIGTIYTVSALLIFFVMWHFGKNAGQYINKDFEQLGEIVVILVILLTLFSGLVIYLAGRLVEQILIRNTKKKLEQLQTYRNNTASLFSEEELFDRTMAILEKFFPNATIAICIFVRKKEKYEIVRTNKKELAFSEQQLELIGKELQNAESLQASELAEYAPIVYDNKIKGFIFLKLPPKVKMNYMELEYYRQISAYASICLKNISVYEKVYQVSIHDDLTGLYNRTYLKEFKEKGLDTGSSQASIYFDIDGFKLYNELYGEACGDKVLRWCSKQILKTVDGRGLSFRVGSNEFLTYIKFQRKEEVIELAKQIQQNIAKDDEEKPEVLQSITLSIGIAFYPDTAKDLEQLQQQAEKANFFAKRNGKNRIELYEMNLEQKENEQPEWNGYDQIAPTIYALTAAIDAKDSYTFQHSVNVSEYAVLLAKEAGLKKDEIRIVKEAGLLHDIGKIGIPEDILKKKGRLTEEEYEIMKTHVANSIKMIHFLPNMNYVIPAVVAHHERFDGKGYPRGMKGEQIPLLGRILAVCDCFDAMTSKRVYKEAMPIEYAVDELEKNKGTQFDPDLAEIFIRLIKEGKISVK